MKKTIDNKCRIIIPLDFRRELNIEANQEIEMEKHGNKIIITNPKGIRSKEEIEKMFHDVSKLKVVTEYQKGFIDALKMVLNK